MYIKIINSKLNSLINDLSVNGYSTEKIFDGESMHFGIFSSGEMNKPCVGEIFGETDDVMICSNPRLLEIVKKYDLKSTCGTNYIKKAKAS